MWILAIMTTALQTICVQCRSKESSVSDFNAFVQSGVYIHIDNRLPSPPYSLRHRNSSQQQYNLDIVTVNQCKDKYLTPNNVKQCIQNHTLFNTDYIQVNTVI